MTSVREMVGQTTALTRMLHSSPSSIFKAVIRIDDKKGGGGGLGLFYVDDRFVKKREGLYGCPLLPFWLVAAKKSQ